MKHKIKQDVLTTLLFARRDWDALLDKVDEIRMQQPGVCGKWSLKDIIAHVTWYEKEMVELFSTLSISGSPLWELETDQRNEKIFQENQFRSLDEVRQESLKVFAQLLTALEQVEPAALLDPQEIAGMPEDWEPLEILASNTWGHYEVHSRHIRDFLNR